jgi:hypothetical protein
LLSRVKEEIESIVDQVAHEFLSGLPLPDTSCLSSGKPLVFEYLKYFRASTPWLFCSDNVWRLMARGLNQMTWQVGHFVKNQAVEGSLTAFDEEFRRE